MIRAQQAQALLDRLDRLEEAEEEMGDDLEIDVFVELQQLRRMRPAYHRIIADARQEEADADPTVRFIIDTLGVYLEPWQRRWYADWTRMGLITSASARRVLGLPEPYQRNSTRRLLNKKRALTRHYARVAARRPHWKEAP